MDQARNLVRTPLVRSAAVAMILIAGGLGVPDGLAKNLLLRDVMARFEAVVPEVEDITGKDAMFPGMGWRDERIAVFLGEPNVEIRKHIENVFQRFEKLSGGTVHLSEDDPGANIFIVDVNSVSEGDLAAAGGHFRRLEDGGADLIEHWNTYRENGKGLGCQVIAKWNWTPKNSYVYNVYLFVEEKINNVDFVENKIEFVSLYCIAPFEVLSESISSSLAFKNFGTPRNCLDEAVIRLLLDKSLRPVFPREDFLRRVRHKAKSVIEVLNTQSNGCGNEI